MLQEFIELNVFAFFMIFARVGTAMALLPGFSAAYVPIRARLGIGLALTFVMVPALFDRLPTMPVAPFALALLIMGEVLIGGFMASLARIMMSALQVAGTAISYFSSMANALIQDPISEQQSSTVAGFLTTTGLVAIFAADLHHVMIRSLVESYALFEPGRMPLIGDMTMSMARRVADAFALGLQLSAPFLLVALTYYIGLGLLGRLMPTLQVFFFGLPFQLAVQLWMLTITVTGILLVFLREFSETYLPYVGG